MIGTVKVLGVSRFKYNEEGNVATNLFLDVTSLVPEGRDGYGQFVSIGTVWKNIPNGIVGKDVVVSVDRYFKVHDIQI